MTSVLVTGANGFIGSTLCRAMIADGHNVRGSVRAAPDDLHDGVDYRASGEIDEATDWRDMLAGVDVVVHTAARVHIARETAADPLAAFCRVNVAGSVRLARQAAETGVKRLIFLSSIGAAVVECATRDGPSLTPYQISKLQAERSLADVSAETGLELVVLRPPLVYGPAAPGNFRRLLAVVSRGLPLPLASIRNRRSVLYAGNLASAVLACLTHPRAPGGVFAVSDGEALSTPEFARLLATALDRPSRLVPFPVGLLRLLGRMTGRLSTIESLTGSLVVDDSDIRTQIGWRPALDTHRALEETVSFNRLAEVRDTSGGRHS